MLRKLGFLFAALALFSIAGGHWAVLQSIAWAGMLRDYTQKTGSVAMAIEQTFNGQHPCELCREIAAAKTKEQKEKPAVPGAKDDVKAKATLPVAVLPSLPSSAALLSWIPADPSLDAGRVEQPPTPPPKSGTIVG